MFITCNSIIWRLLSSRERRDSPNKKRRGIRYCWWLPRRRRDTEVGRIRPMSKPTRISCMDTFTRSWTNSISTKYQTTSWNKSGTSSHSKNCIPNPSSPTRRSFPVPISLKWKTKCFKTKAGNHWPYPHAMFAGSTTKSIVIELRLKLSPFLEINEQNKK